MTAPGRPKREFTTAWHESMAGPRLWLPLGAASILGMWGLFADQLMLTAASLVFTAIAVRNWPFSDPGRVILRLNEDGLDVDGIGHVDWAMIDKVELKRPRAAKVDPAPFLLVRLTAPIADLAQPTPAFERPRWQRRLSKPLNDTDFILPVRGLFDPEADVIGAFSDFLGDRFIKEADAAPSI